jgi:hypothetical protein
MTRRGRCQCGTILQFHPGPQGYKMRCPRCGSVVRLRVDDEPTRIRPPSEPFLHQLSESEGPEEPFAEPHFPRDPARAAAAGRPSLFELDVRAPQIATKSVIVRRGRRLWWAAGLALLTAAALGLVWFFK